MVDFMISGARGRLQLGWHMFGGWSRRVLATTQNYDNKSRNHKSKNNKDNDNNRRF